MRLIDADELIWCLAYYYFHSYGKAEYAYGVAAEEVNKLPTIDAVPVVRCEHCKEAVACRLYGDYWGIPPEKGIFCKVWHTVVDKNGYCYQGAKMDGGAEDG